MAKAIWIKADETHSAVEPENGKTFELEQLQELVGGYIEIVPITYNSVMVVNEEGQLLGLPINKPATIIAQRIIVGDVLLADRKLIK